MLGKVGPRNRKTIIAVCIVAVLVCAGLLIGLLLGLLPGRRASSSSSSAANSDRQDLSQLQQLPPPGSEAARKLQADPATPAWIRELYDYEQDAAAITREYSATFLSQLSLQQQQLQQLQASLYPRGAKSLVNSTATATPAAATAAAAASSQNALQIDVEPFIRVATDVLNYLRFCRSRTLLQLLRDFSATGQFDLQSTDPDELQSEVEALLNLENLNRWYLASGRSDSVGRSAGSGKHSGAKAAVQVVGPAGRRLAAASLNTPSSGALLRRIKRRQQHSRRLQAATAAYVIPEVNTAGRGLPTDSPQQSLKQMLCSIQSFSPTGLAGVLPAAAAGKEAVDGCSMPRMGLFSYKGVVFQPLVIPIVFHCLRFKKGSTLAPPIFDPLATGQNLVDVANKLYKGTGIQFKLQQVRSDPVQFPYLMMPSMEAWQACSANPPEDEKGFPCLTRLAQEPSVAPIVEDQHAINVFVAGARDEPTWCDPTAQPAPICTQLYAGYCGASGPWFADQEPQPWSEDKTEDNWLSITWDMFNPATRNSARFWNGGGVTFAHELGHFLGLMHTHEAADSSSECDANGIAKGDAVPDTPANIQVDAWAAEQNLLAALTGWCSDFRVGEKPKASELLQFRSCAAGSKQQKAAVAADKLGDAQIDNVWNVMSYSPDPCSMMFSPNQVARMQWAVATFRPKAMQQHAA
uniref:Peptidase M43 pregnancy-associated plasma-A domain-containing protein n=1 Tax=Tetradesmus obliquus TaxID=3088 RepID=A0A383VZJ4_TETOB|eukprot:jgi/Sobl393_1/11851/SZX70641.1